MPTIKVFNGFKIYMYFADERPPHFHVVGPDFSAKVGIEDLLLLAGDLPKKARVALKWAAENKQILNEKWSEFNEQ